MENWKPGLTVSIWGKSWGCNGGTSLLCPLLLSRSSSPCRPLWSVSLWLLSHLRPPCLIWLLEPLPKPIFSCWNFLARAPLKLMMESLKMTLEAKRKQQKTWNQLQSICSSVIHLRAPISHVKQKMWFIIHISPVQPWLKQTTLMKCWFHASGTLFQIREYLEL